jgi:hypothetical protein
MSAEQVANAFVQHYYQTFDTNPNQLTSLFVRNECVLFCFCARYGSILTC